MTAGDDIRSQISKLRRWSDAARRRAALADAAAARYEEQARRSPASVRQTCLQMAALQRQVKKRHAIAASLHDQHADRLCAVLDRRSAGPERPWFMDTIAAAIGMPSAAITLRGLRGEGAMAAVSDPFARAAHDLEFALGEGPAHSVAAEGREVQAVGPALCVHWPRYGPEAIMLGVHAVIAVPLRPPPARMGSICAYDRVPRISREVAAAIASVADALPLTLSRAARDRPPDDFVLIPSLFGDSDTPAVVHQAAGVVSQQCRCGIDDALALLRARAFATGHSAEKIAMEVVRGELRLG